eukprot:199705-Pleurochrysis_carterae.AAC.5
MAPSVGWPRATQLTAYSPLATRLHMTMLPSAVPMSRPDESVQMQHNWRPASSSVCFKKPS